VSRIAPVAAESILKMSSTSRGEERVAFAPDSSPQRLLLADEPIVLATLADALRRAGFEVTTVTEASEALEQARRARFSLAVLDYAMPGQNGLELAAGLAQLRQPFMFLSACNDESLVGQAVTAGALAYLVKPIDPPQLVPTVRTAVRRAREIEALIAQSQRLSDSIETNRDVSVAVGLAMAHRGLTRQAAYETLRQHARRMRRPLRELATEIIAGVERLHAIPGADLSAAAAAQQPGGNARGE